MDEFRNGQLNVLISTAIIEEGIDVPACNLVIRFNKPANFSSYMQSKGRARAKEGARFVLLRDESDSDEYSKNSEEYRNYEEMEKVRSKFSTKIKIENLFQMLQRNFREESACDDSSNDDDDDALLRPYRPNSKVRIDGVTAVQTIHQ
jgi:ERCC4-related helicase